MDTSGNRFSERCEKMATFSVIVPVYNAAHTIERCVDSIASSGGEDVQIILIEDCARDNSWEACQRLARKYSTVTCLRNERNRGVSHTRNRGLEAATGEYLLFVDSDDYVAPDYVEAFRSAIAEGGRFAVCGYMNHDEKYAGRTDAVCWHDFQGTKQVPLKQELENLFRATLLQQLWNKVFVRQVVEENHIRFDESVSLGEDTRFILDYLACLDAQQVTLINAPLYHYMRDQEGSLMFRVGYESVEESLKNLHKLYMLMGLPQEELESRLAQDRRKQTELYAYLIMHNAGMAHREKKRLILRLDAARGRTLYRDNIVMLWKERILKGMKKLGLR